MRGDRVLASRRVDEWLDALASESPLPGAAAFAALAGASGAGLVAMVARLTLKRQEMAGVADRMNEIVAEADSARGALLGLADAGAEAYDAVMERYRHPPADADRPAWLHELQEALEAAAEVSLDIARRCVYLLGLAEDAVELGNPNAVSEGMTAAAALNAATVGAIADVRANAFAFVDAERRSELHDTCARLQERATSVLHDVQVVFMAKLPSA